MNLDITKTWYAENTGAGGMFDNLKLYFNSLKCNGLMWGYYPDSTIIIMIVHPDNLKAGEWFGTHHWFTDFTGVICLHSYIRDDNSKIDWIKK